MHIIDIILGIFLLIFIIKGIRNGLIQSVVGLIGLILTILAITKFGTFVKLTLIENFGLNEILSLIIAYILIVILVYLITRIIIKILHLVIGMLHLGWLNRLLGMVFGLLNGALIIAIMLALINLAPKSETINNFISPSKIVRYVNYSTQFLQTEYSEILNEDGTLQKELKELEDETKDVFEKTKKKIEDKIKN